MGFQDSFNDRVMPAMERAFGTAVTFRRGESLIELTVPFGRRETAVDRKALLNDKGATVRTREFPVATSELKIGGDWRWPEAGDEFTWIDAASGEQSWVVFPLVSDQCYRFFDNTDTRLRVYTVAKDELRELRLTIPGAASFTAAAIVSTRSTIEDYRVSSGEATADESVIAYIPTASFPAEFDMPARELEIFELVDGDVAREWAIDLTTTRWGRGLVELGMKRTPLLSMGELRRG